MSKYKWPSKAKLIEERALGLTYQQIADKHGMSRMTAYYLINGRKKK